MKIGVISNSFHSPIKKAMKLANKMGLEGVQMWFSGYTAVDRMNDKRISLVQQLLDKYNLEISAFCGDLGGHGFQNEKENVKKIELTKKMIDIASKMNVKVITTHIGMIPSDKQSETYITLKNSMREIGEYGYSKNVTLAIETGPEIAIVLKQFVEDLLGVGVNLDPANFVMVTGQDPVEAVKILSNYIVHTHAKDGKKLREGSPEEVYAGAKPKEPTPMFTETPLGEGSVNWEKYLEALKSIGYNGYLTIERETKKFPYETVLQAYNFLTEKLNRKKEIVVAVVGCGGIANAVHFPSISKIKAYKIKYCIDIVLERAEKATSKYGVNGYTKTGTDYKVILSDKEVDAVIVCTHTYMHGKIAMDCMLAGKHVLSEKPVAMNYAEAEQMLAVSQSTGMINNIGVCMRFNGAVNAIKKLIESGELGDIYSIYCSFRSFRNIPGIGGEFTNKAHSGGGVLLDWGVHFIDLIMYCISSPEILSASGEVYSKLGENIENYKTRSIGYNLRKDKSGIYDVDEYVTAFVRTKDISISINGAWAQNIDKEEKFIDFLGIKGGIRMKYFGNFELFTERNGKLVTVKPKFDNKDIYFEEHRAFVKDIINGTKSRAYIESILPTTKILDAIYKSSETKKEINF